MIKGPFLFVFKNETSSSPLYAVSLAHLKPVTKEEAHGNTTVELQTGLGDVEYEVIFHTAGNHERPRMFANMVTHQAAAGEAEEVRKVSHTFDPGADEMHFLFSLYRPFKCNL